jgi:hypothetical protein
MNEMSIVGGDRVVNCVDMYLYIPLKLFTVFYLFAYPTVHVLVYSIISHERRPILWAKKARKSVSVIINKDLVIPTLTRSFLVERDMIYYKH